MPQRYYLDSCIWRDYLENRSDRFRPLGEWATRLINKIIREKDIFVVTDLVEKELLKYCKRDEIQKMFQIIPEELFFSYVITEMQTRQALLLVREKKTPFFDTLHAFVAKDLHAIFITRDVHFQELQEIVEIHKPEDLL